MIVLAGRALRRAWSPALLQQRRTIVRVAASTEDYRATLKASEWVIAKFGATWCKPCQKSKAYIEELSQERPDLVFLEVDVDDLPQIADEEGVNSIPMYKVFKYGKAIDVHIASKLWFDCKRSSRGAHFIFGGGMGRLFEHPLHGGKVYRSSRGSATARRVHNVTEGPVEDRMMTTGQHSISDIYCNRCGSNLGWKYLESSQESQKYKRGKYILERVAAYFDWVRWPNCPGGNTPPKARLNTSRPVPAASEGMHGGKTQPVVDVDGRTGAPRLSGGRRQTAALVEDLLLRSLVLVVLVLQKVRGHVRKLHAGRALDVAKVFDDSRLDLLEVLGGVVVGHGGGSEVEVEVGRVVVVVLVQGNLRRHVLVPVQHDPRLVGPAARDVANGVAAAAQHEQRDVEAAAEGHAARVALVAQVEAAQAVARQAVGAALEHDGARVVDLDALPDDDLEEVGEAVVVHAVVQRHVHAVVLARRDADVGHVARAREEVAELVEADGHDAVRDVKGLLDAVAVVHVDVNVHDARVVLEQLQDAQHDVVEVAEARRLGALRVVQPPRPVDADVRLLVVEAVRRVDGGAAAALLEHVEPVEDGAVRRLSHVEALQLVGELAVVVRAHPREELHVLVVVEREQLRLHCLVRAEHLHVAVEVVAKHQRVRHADALRLHRMPWAVVVAAHVGVVKVGHALLHCADVAKNWVPFAGKRPRSASTLNRQHTTLLSPVRLPEPPMDQPLGNTRAVRVKRIHASLPADIAGRAELFTMQAPRRRLPEG
ncbi:thioredoxin, putative [Babesia caballi]|uniref:Thioredoxin, putative n=1 Tax=Babesia caballi TaxID=5871 RepID=A0AAV4LUD0_BABCB|nr:thioredoxin, putative [Babesia caballi]